MKPIRYRTCRNLLLMLRLKEAVPMSLFSEPQEKEATP